MNVNKDDSKRFLQMFKKMKILFNNINEDDFQEFIELINKMVSDDDDFEGLGTEDIEKIRSFNNNELNKIFELFRFCNNLDEDLSDNINIKFIELCKNNNYTEIKKYFEKNKNKIDYSFIDIDGFNSIYYLLKNDRTNFIEEIIILKKDIGLNLIMGDNETLLIKAIKKNNFEIAQKIIDYIDIETLNYEDNDKLNAFYLACQKKNIKLIKKMLSFEGLNVNCLNSKNESVLCHIIKNSLFENEIIKILEKDFKYFKTSYFLDSILKNFKNLSNIIYDKYKDIIDFTIKDEENSNCLMLSIFQNMKLLSLKMIKDGKINLNEIDNAKHTAFTYACQQSEKEIAFELLKYNININHTIDDGSSPLILCCDRKSIVSVGFELLKRDNIDVSIVNEKKETALLIASKERLENLALEILKKNNSKPEHCDEFNKTVLYWSTYNNLYNLSYELLNKYDCLPYLIESNINDQSLIHACKNNMEDIALMILQDERVEWYESNHAKVNIFNFIFKQNMHYVILRIIELMDIEFVIDNINLLKLKIKESNSSKRILYQKEISKKINIFDSNYDISFQLFEYL